MSAMPKTKLRMHGWDVNKARGEAKCLLASRLCVKSFILHLQPPIYNRYTVYAPKPLTLAVRLCSCKVWLLTCQYLDSGLMNCTLDSKLFYLCTDKKQAN